MVGLIVNVVHPDELAVGVQIRLAEGVQVAGNVLGIGIAIADTVKVMRLDLGHERKLRVDLLLRERLDGDDKIARDGDTGLLILDRHGDGDVLCRLAGQRTVDLHARGVVHAGGTMVSASLLVMMTGVYLPSTPKSRVFGKWMSLAAMYLPSRSSRGSPVTASRRPP